MARITFWGDFKADEVDRLSLSGELQLLLNTSDYNVVNFEAPIRSEEKAMKKSGPNIWQNTDAPTWIEEHGFNVVSLANNHTMDYGREGAIATKDAFKSARIIGCGTWDEAYKLEVVTSSDGKRIGFLACTHCEFGTLTDKWRRDEFGAAWLSHPDVYNMIQNGGGKNVDCLIAIVHAGVEYMDVPLPEIRDVYRRMIDLGADAVIASHPHVPQGWEWYKGKPICYSLGNFCFSRLKKKETPAHWYESLCCVLTVDKSHEVSMEIKSVLYQPEVNYISENHSEDFQKHLEYLNEVLRDDRTYMKVLNAGVKELFPHYKNQFTRGGFIRNPFSQGFLKGIADGFLGRGFFRHEHWLNNIQCESHRWAILRAMKLLKKS